MTAGLHRSVLAERIDPQPAHQLRAADETGSGGHAGAIRLMRVLR
jgi:hypothetical protein